MHHDQVGFIPAVPIWFNIQKSINVNHHINRLKKKNHTIISIDAEEEAFGTWQILTPIHDLKKKTVTRKLRVNIIFNGEKLPH